MSNCYSPRAISMYMRVAKAVSQSSTCDRANVGCVIVNNGAIIATGYNGSAAGDYHCNDVGHLVVDGHCLRVVHSEENAIINAAKSGASTLGATMFCTHEPCYRCCQRIINSGIRTVYFTNSYGQHSQDKQDLLDRCGLSLIMHQEAK